MRQTRINILNKEGYLTEADRRQPLSRGCEYFTFQTCLDLSEPIKVIPYGKATEFSIDNYSQDLARFISWWVNQVLVDLLNFTGFSNVTFELVGFTLVN